MDALPDNLPSMEPSCCLPHTVKCSNNRRPVSAWHVLPLGTAVHAQLRRARRRSPQCSAQRVRKEVTTGGTVLRLVLSPAAGSEAADGLTADFKVRNRWPGPGRHLQTPAQQLVKWRTHTPPRSQIKGERFQSAQSLFERASGAGQNAPSARVPLSKLLSAGKRFRRVPGPYQSQRSRPLPGASERRW